LKNITYASIIAVAALASPVAAETCDNNPNVTLDMSAVQSQRELNHELVCNGINRAVEFFQSIPELQEQIADVEINVKVQDVVEFTLFDDPMRVYGIYDRSKNTVTMSSWGTDYLHPGSRDAFTLPISTEIHTSVVAHETAHVILQAISQDKNLPSAFHELWAYTVQIATMDDEVRDAALAAYPSAEFMSEAQINDMVHYGDPHKFGVMSYKWMLKNGFDTHLKIVAGNMPNVLDQLL
jgi:hypothetical protein